MTPCFQDVPSFLQLREDCRAVLENSELTAGSSVRFVVLDDTAGADPQIAQLDDLDDVLVVEPPFNLGHQRGIVYALRSSRDLIDEDDIVVTLDADGEDRPSDIPRLVEALCGPGTVRGTVVLAARTSREESWSFKIFYRLFRLVFRSLTGTTIQTGNFVAYRGDVVHRLLSHPHFDLCYSSSFISLDIPTVLVPCARGSRYAGRSRMNRTRLVTHGLRMLMPFVDRIAVRTLAGLSMLIAVTVLMLLTAAGIRLFTDLALGSWMGWLSVAMIAATLLGVASAIILFALFSQSRGISLNGLEIFDVRSTRNAPARPD